MGPEASGRTDARQRNETPERRCSSSQQVELVLAAKDRQIEELQSLLSRITVSPEWKIANRLGQIIRAAAPAGSRRRSMLKRLIQMRRPPGRFLSLPGEVVKSGVRKIAPSTSPRSTAREFDQDGTAAGKNQRVHPRHQHTARPGTTVTHHHPGFDRAGEVLIIDHRLPSPDRDCGSLRMVELIREILSLGCRVTFIPDNFLVWPPYFQDLQAMGVEVVHPPKHHSVAEFLKDSDREYDLAIISRAGIAAKHLSTVRRLAPRARIVFDTVDLHFLREERKAAVARDAALHSEAADQRRQELRLAAEADLTVVVSPVEKEILERESPGIEVLIIPTIYPVDPTEPPGFEDRGGIVFIGGFAHAPNVDAVLYFAHEILPRIRQRVPGVVFNVIGPEPPPEINALECSDIRILGYVADVRPIFDRALVSVAPLRYGAGVKGKVNHAMALGLPSVVTSLAAEGMYLEHERDIMIADDPQSFADVVVRLHESPDLWRRLSRNSRDHVRRYFSVEAAAEPIRELLAWAGLPRLGSPSSDPATTAGPRAWRPS